MDKFRDLFWAFKCNLRLYLIVINGLSPIRTDLDSLTKLVLCSDICKFNIHTAETTLKILYSEVAFEF